MLFLRVECIKCSVLCHGYSVFAQLHVSLLSAQFEMIAIYLKQVVSQSFLENDVLKEFGQSC